MKNYDMEKVFNIEGTEANTKDDEDTTGQMDWED